MSEIGVLLDVLVQGVGENLRELLDEMIRERRQRGRTAARGGELLGLLSGRRHSGLIMRLYVAGPLFTEVERAFNLVLARSLACADPDRGRDSRSSESRSGRACSEWLLSDGQA
jgi:hypothetical protein